MASQGAIQNPATIGEVLTYLLGRDWEKDDQFLHWPPDVFAASGLLLQKSGAYINVIERWPRNKHPHWAKLIAEIAEEWKGLYTKSTKEAPARVLEWWKIIKDPHNARRPIEEIRDNEEIWLALVGLCCAADEICAGIGFWPLEADLKSNQLRDFLMDTVKQLYSCLNDNNPSTLCKKIHYSRVVVLPKVHTPQKGITFRSISHNLALADSADIKASWRLADVAPTKSASSVDASDHSAVILVVPHPYELSPSQFQPSEPPNGFLTEMDQRFGFFNYVAEKPKTAGGITSLIVDLYEEAKKKVGRVDGIVLPEMALTPAEYESLLDDIKRNREDVWFLCSGVAAPPSANGAGENFAAIWKRLVGQVGFKSRQHKHHRWVLDESQICQYGIGGLLDPVKKWWENISIQTRELNIVALKSWLTVSVLICEDLARPDPVGNTIRAVGPNLIVALLQDGPQLSSRWSARCATVLTDDPGCSVLTVTSLGMTQLSRPHKDSVGQISPSRVVAHWKDRETGSKEIYLPDDKNAVVLCLSRKPEIEFSADGRKSERAALVKLTGVHYI